MRTNRDTTIRVYIDLSRTTTTRNAERPLDSEWCYRTDAKGRSVPAGNVAPSRHVNARNCHARRRTHRSREIGPHDDTRFANECLQVAARVGCRIDGCARRSLYRFSVGMMVTVIRRRGCRVGGMVMVQRGGRRVQGMFGAGHLTEVARHWCADDNERQRNRKHASSHRELSIPNRPAVGDWERSSRHQLSSHAPLMLEAAIRARPGDSAGQPCNAISGWKCATMRRIPSFQCTCVLPINACCFVRSIVTDWSV